MTFEIALLGPCSLVLRSFGGFYLQTNAAKVVGTVHSTLQEWERTIDCKNICLDNPTEINLHYKMFRTKKYKPSILK